MPRVSRCTATVARLARRMRKCACTPTGTSGWLVLTTGGPWRRRNGRQRGRARVARAPCARGASGLREREAGRDLDRHSGRRGAHRARKRMRRCGAWWARCRMPSTTRIARPIAPCSRPRTICAMGTACSTSWRATCCRRAAVCTPFHALSAPAPGPRLGAALARGDVPTSRNGYPGYFGFSLDGDGKIVEFSLFVKGDMCPSGTDRRCKRNVKTLDEDFE